MKLTPETELPTDEITASRMRLTAQAKALIAVGVDPLGIVADIDDATQPGALDQWAREIRADERQQAADRLRDNTPTITAYLDNADPADLIEFIANLLELPTNTDLQQTNTPSDRDHQAIRDLHNPAHRPQPTDTGKTNTDHQRITEMWAWVADDDTGEGVTGFKAADGTWMPLVGADPDRARSLRPIAEDIAKLTGRPVTLLRFTDRTDVETITR